MDQLLRVALGIVLLPYFLNPILLRFRLREFCETNLEEIPECDLTEEVKSYLDLTAVEFKRAGFYHCAYATSQTYAGNGMIYISLWFHRAEGISAYSNIAYKRSPNGPNKLFAKSICFVTRFSESSQFETSISGVPTPLAKRPLLPCVQLPKTMRFQDLFNAHMELARKFHPSTERLLPLEGQELAMMKRKATETLQHQIQAGRRKVLDSNPDMCRPTWKGALINGWQFAWPVNDIRKWLLKRRAEKLVTALEIEKSKP